MLQHWEIIIYVITFIIDFFEEKVIVIIIWAQVTSAMELYYFLF